MTHFRGTNATFAVPPLSSAGCVDWQREMGPPVPHLAMPIPTLSLTKPTLLCLVGDMCPAWLSLCQSHLQRVSGKTLAFLTRRSKQRLVSTFPLPPALDTEVILGAMAIMSQSWGECWHSKAGEGGGPEFLKEH